MSGARAADPDLPGPRHAAARSTRLVSGLSELNNLFRSVIDSQSDDRLAPEAARSTAQDESEAARPTAQDESEAARSTAPDESEAARSTAQSFYAGDAPQSADRHEETRPDAAARWTGPGTDDAREAASGAPFAPRRQVALRANTLASGHAPIDTPFASFAGAASTPPDPAREDVLLDRLLDRLEERLREQAIRHLGFTGGVT